MAWSSILGHEAVAARFRESIARGRLSHAYLFVGPDGIGKELFARELAKAVLCAAESGEACDACPSCHKVEHGNHPDVAVVRRIERGVKGERRTRILIEQVREEIQDVIAFKPFEGRYKVFLVSDADQMTEEAQNCLLKTLEEPPPHSLLILVASRLERFVDTVVSRCQIVRFRPLAAEAVERILVERQAVAPEAARVLARLSAGSPGRALHYQASGAYDTVTWLFGELAGLVPGGEFALAAELLDRTKESGDRLEDAREQLRSVLDLLTLAGRDRWMAELGCAADQQVWAGSSEAVNAALAGVSAGSARRLVEAALAARERLDQNANIKLVLEKLLLDMCSLLHSREALLTR
jgi:DNA polymerase III subunit delta'